jgi:hypothetical protein
MHRLLVESQAPVPGDGLSGVLDAKNRDNFLVHTLIVREPTRRRLAEAPLIAARVAGIPREALYGRSVNQHQWLAEARS